MNKFHNYVKFIHIRKYWYQWTTYRKKNPICKDIICSLHEENFHM